MCKVLQSCIICAIILLGGNMEEDVQQYLINPTNAQIIINGECAEVKNIDKLSNVLKTMLQHSHTMPAFGVSINSETQKEIKKGVWLKLIFNQTKWVNGMNFDELLIQVEPTFSGFNVIRGNNNVYDGRCYYIDLVDNTMDNLYQCITRND